MVKKKLKEEKQATLVESIKEVKEKAKPRKFTQSFDLIINLKNLDLKKPENRLNLEFVLPEGKGKDIKVVVFADSLVSEAKKYADLVLSKSDITTLAENKSKLKKITNEYEWFFGEATLMPLIGKKLGVVLGGKNKMPKPLPPKANVEEFVKLAKKSVRIRIKDSPVIQVSVGSEKLKYEQVAKNIEVVYNFVKEKLPKGRNNIKNVYLKLTMSKPIKLNI